MEDLAEWKKIVEDVADEVFDLFADTSAVLCTPPESRALLYRSYHQNDRALKTRRRCLFPGCSRRSIASSHTVPKEASLRLISERNHVLQPQFRSGSVQMLKVGVGHASTYPGFCEEHERLFGSYEKSKIFSGEEQLVSQVFRSICREMVVQQVNLECLIRQEREYVQIQQEHFRKETDSRLVQRGAPSDIIKSVSLTFEDRMLAALREETAKRRTILTSFERDLYAPSCHDVLATGGQHHLVYQFVEVDHSIPVCLAGRGGFGYSVDDQSDQFTMILNVLPFEDRTYILAAANPRHRELFYQYMDYQTQHGLALLSMVESWMVHGSDHWFMKPSVWNSIDSARKAKILGDILDEDRHIAQEYELSILDDLRRYILDSIEREHQRRDFDERAWRYLEGQRRKLTRHAQPASG